MGRVDSCGEGVYSIVEGLADRDCLMKLFAYVAQCGEHIHQRQDNHPDPCTEKKDAQENKFLCLQDGRIGKSLNNIETPTQNMLDPQENTTHRNHASPSTSNGLFSSPNP